MNQLFNNPDFRASQVCKTFTESPFGFIDIGARGGAHKLIEPAASMSAVMCFEPDPPEFEKLSEEATNWPFATTKIVPVALSDKKGDEKLYITKNPNNISLLKPAADFYHRYGNEGLDVVDEINVTTTTLDSVLFENERDMHLWGELLKVDAQGADLMILKGAEKALSSRVVAVVCEACFIELYDGQALFSDIEVYLRKFGFSFYGFIESNVRSRRMLDKKKIIARERFFWVDAIFMKDPISMTGKAPKLSMREIHSLFISTILLGYYDFALELAIKFWAKGEEEERIKRLINAMAEYPPEKTAAEVEALSARIKADPANANIYAGKFADSRRTYFDYKDIKDQ